MKNDNDMEKDKKNYNDTILNKLRDKSKESITIENDDNEKTHYCDIIPEKKIG